MAITEEFVVVQKKYERLDPRLGRNVRHDSRSLQYLFPAADDISRLKSIRHRSHIPTLDQGQLGSCTGNASTKCMSYDKFWAQGQTFLSATDSNANESYAVGVYSEATALDPFEGSYPPTDTGSDGLSVAKVFQKRQLISGYQHATSIEALLTALASHPVIVGTEWRRDMFSPAVDGRISITGDVEGGHEYCLDEIDVEKEIVWIQNSWGDSWGRTGRAYVAWDDMKSLLKADGDCTIFAPVSQPAPQPVPPEPVPPHPVVTGQEAFVSAAKAWLGHPHASRINQNFVTATRAYLKYLSGR